MSLPSVRRRSCSAHHARAAEAAWESRALRLPAAGDRGDQDQGPGVAGDRRLRARPLGPRPGGHPGGGVGRAGGAFQVHGEPDLPGAGQPVRGLAEAGLSEYELDYLFCDASFFRYHPAAKGEPILCSWGITTQGKKVFISLSAGAAESYDSWHAHFSDLRERGLKPPLLGITDGAHGLVSAFEQVFSESLRQKCTVHGCRNVLEKVSKADLDQVKKDYWSIFNGIEAPPGEEAVTVAQERATQFAEKYASRYPRAMDCLLDNLSALTAHLQFPVEQRERIRHTNLLERTFGESRRRVKVIGRLPGENSCLSLVWAVLDRASVGWRGLETSVPGIRRLQDLRHQLLGPPELRATG
jgi:putative transposase